MIISHFHWRTQKRTYQNGEDLYLNRIRVGDGCWNMGRSKGDKDDSTKWVGHAFLPSLKDLSKRVYGSTLDEVKSKVERIVNS